MNQNPSIDLSEFIRENTIRVFLSSTFRDFQEERNILVKRVFPALRKRCRAHSIRINEIDLRWGVPEHAPSLRVCINELQHCQPFFVCMLGASYGTRTGDQDIGQIEKHFGGAVCPEPGVSFTEVEILYVLNNPERFPHCSFFVKDATDERQQPDDDDNAQQNLIDKIREACKQFPTWHFVSGLRDAEEICNRIHERLDAEIDLYLPKLELRHTDDLESIENRAYQQSRLHKYIPVPTALECLNEYLKSTDGLPLVVLGDPGAGKSSLLAYWTASQEKAALDSGNDFNDRIFYHFLGVESSVANSTLASLLRRMFKTFQSWGIMLEAEIPESAPELTTMLSHWLHELSKVGGATIVVDAVNKFQHAEDRALGWIPRQLPENVRMIFSSNDATLAKLANVDTIQMPLLDSDLQREVISNYLASRGKVLEEHQLERIVNAKQCANPLYLRVLLNRLCVQGDRGQIGCKLEVYLNAPDVKTLFAIVLTELTTDHDLQPVELEGKRSLIGMMLCLMKIAKRGLENVELRALLFGALIQGSEQARLSPQVWLSLATQALDEFVSWNHGRLVFCHEALADAVEATFFNDASWQDSTQELFEAVAKDWKSNRYDASLQEYSVEFGPRHLLDGISDQSLRQKSLAYLVDFDFILLASELRKIDSLCNLFAELAKDAPLSPEDENERAVQRYLDALGTPIAQPLPEVDINSKNSKQSDSRAEFELVVDFVRRNRSNLSTNRRVVAQTIYNWTTDWEIGKRAEEYLNSEGSAWFRRIDIPLRISGQKTAYPNLEVGGSGNLELGFDVSADGRVGAFCVRADKEGTDWIEVWDLKLGRKQHHIPIDVSGGVSVHCHDGISLRHGEDELLVVSKLDELLAVNKKTGYVEVVQAAGSNVAAVKTSLNGKLAFVGHLDGRLSVIDLGTKEIMRDFQIFKKTGVQRIVVSPTGDGGIAAGGRSEGLAMVNIRDNLYYPIEIQGTSGVFESIATDFRGDSILAAECFYRNVGSTPSPAWRIWHVDFAKQSSANLGELDNHVHSMQLTGSGRFAVITSVQGTIALMEFTEDGRNKIAETSVPSGVTSVKMRIDGSRLFYITAGGQYRTQGIQELASMGADANHSIWMGVGIDDNDIATLHNNYGYQFEVDLKTPPFVPEYRHGGTLAVNSGMFDGKQLLELDDVAECVKFVVGSEYNSETILQTERRLSMLSNVSNIGKFAVIEAGEEVSFYQIVGMEQTTDFILPVDGSTKS